MATVSIYLRTERKNKQGFCPVQIKIKHKGCKDVYLPVQSVRVNPEHWDQSAYAVSTEHPNARLINQKIQQEKLKIEEALLYLEVNGHGYNREMLHARLGGYQEHDFFDFWERTVNSRGVKLAPNTIRNYGVNFRKLKQFRKSLTFNEITLDFLEGLEAWCINKGNKPNTISKLMKNISFMVNRAKATIGIENNAFSHYHMPGEETIREVFSIVTLDKLLRCLYSGRFKDTLSKECLALFCLQSLTGLRYADAVKFNATEYVKENKILIRTEKTGFPVYIPLHPRLRDLLEFQNYQFRYTPNQVYNRVLKGIATAVGIPINLTSHIAVHSFCTISMELGMSLKVIQKIRGHRSIKTTEIYTKVKDTYVDKEMERWSEGYFETGKIVGIAQ